MDTFASRLLQRTQVVRAQMEVIKESKYQRVLKWYWTCWEETVQGNVIYFVLHR